MTGRIHSFESFGTVDGPGIRFVVFLQGCPLRCQYCHNPDTWGAGGEEYEAETIARRAIRYKNYFGKDGGVTVTGGEPLLQIEFVIELFTILKKQGVHTCVDTSGFTFRKDDAKSVELHKKLLEVTDLFLLDIKHIDDIECKKLTGQSNKNTLDFAKKQTSASMPKDIAKEIEKLKGLMNVASKQLDFETAIELRDRITVLKKELSKK